MSIVKSIKSLGGTSFSKYPLDPANYRGLMGDLFLPGGQGPLHQFTYGDKESCLLAYSKCPPLTAVINKLAGAYVNGKTFVMDLKEEKESTIPFAKKLRQRLIRPNPIQTWKQFEAQQSIIKDACGFSLLLPILPVGYKEIIDCSSMWNIPPSMLDISETNKLFYQNDISGMVDKIVLTYRGEKTEIQDKPFFIFKDFLPSLNSMIFPESRILSLEKPISNIMGALESRGVLINYRGALGILSSTGDKNGYVPIKAKEKEELQRDFKRYGLRDSQWKFIITSAMVNWQQMGIPTKDLMLFEEIEDDVNMICDSYGYPIDLMAGSQRKTYQNAPEAGKHLYQDTTIPQSENMYEVWNILFKCEENGCKMIKDYGHIPVLQANKSEESLARLTLDQALEIEYKKGLITLDDWLIELGRDKLPSGIGNVRATDPGASNVPLAVTIGVGGVDGLISVLTAQGLSPEARQAILEITFGISSIDAQRMVVVPVAGSNENNQV